MPGLEKNLIFPQMIPSLPASAGRDATELRYRRLFETAPYGILVWSADNGTIVDANPRSAELIGRARGELVGRKLWEIEPLQEIATAVRSLHDRRAKNPVRAEGVMLDVGNGRSRRVDVVASLAVIGGERMIQGALHESKRRPEALLAAGIEEILTRELHRAHRSGAWVSVALLAVGGTGSSASLEAIRSRIRGSDVVTPYGDRTFLIVLPDLGLEDARRRVERIADDLARSSTGQVVVGVASSPHHGRSADALLRAVELSLKRG